MGGRTGHVLRSLGFLLWAILAVVRASAAEPVAVILIDPLRAGPLVDPATYVHETWILWPAKVDSGGNRVLSLLSGLDWNASDMELAHTGTSTAGTFRLRGWAHLERAGFFQARRKTIGLAKVDLLADSTGQTTNAAILVAAQPESDSVSAKPLASAFQPNTIVVCQADNWNDVAAIAGRVRRSAVLEFPPAEHASWSRFWLRGDWPRGLPVASLAGIPGLIPARLVGSLVLDPRTVKWRVDDAGSWGGANRWLERARESTFELLIAVGMLLGYVMLCAVYLVSQEKAGRLASLLLHFLLLVPAAFVLEGRFAVWLGSDSAWLSFVLAWTSVASLAGLLRLAPGAARMSRLTCAGFAGLLGCLAGDPRWSLLNPVWYGHLEAFSFWATGCLLLYVALLCDYPAPVRWVRAATSGGIVLLSIGGFLGAWWADGVGTVALAPIVLLVAGWGWIRPSVLPALVLFPSSVASIALYGFTATPDGLVRTAAEGRAVRFDIAFDLFGSPAVLVVLGISAVLAMVGGKFLWHQALRAVRASAGERGLLLAAASIGAMAILEPRLMPSFLLLALAAMMVLMIEALAAG